MEQQGIVKFYNQEQGFGIIKVPEKKKEFLVHVTGLVDKIAEGDSVSFEVVDSSRGKTAINVKKTA